MISTQVTDIESLDDTISDPISEDIIDFHPLTSNITIVTDNGKIKTHKYIVCKISPMWETVIKDNPDLKEIDCHFDITTVFTVLKEKYKIKLIKDDIVNTTNIKLDIGNSLDELFEVYELVVYLNCSSSIIIRFAELLINKLTHPKVDNIKEEHVLRYLHVKYDTNLLDKSILSHQSSLKIYFRIININDLDKKISPNVKMVLFDLSNKVMIYLLNHHHPTAITGKECWVCPYVKSLRKKDLPMPGYSYCNDCKNNCKMIKPKFHYGYYDSDSSDSNEIIASGRK